MGTAVPGHHQSRGAVNLGLARDMVVQELGWDSDCDEDVRTEVMDIIDADLIEDSQNAVDCVLLWWREGDGDVVDGLIDALTDLAATGCIWLLTPKIGRVGYLSPADLAEGVTTAGLSLTRTVDIAPDWQAHRIVRPKSQRR